MLELIEISMREEIFQMLMVIGFIVPLSSCICIGIGMILKGIYNFIVDKDSSELLKEGFIMFPGGVFLGMMGAIILALWMIIVPVLTVMGTIYFTRFIVRNIKNNKEQYKNLYKSGLRKMKKFGDLI